MTWLEIVDSAVKIGLGASVAGVSALFLAGAQHRNALEKARNDREFQLLKEVAEKVERFTHSALRYWAFASDWHRALRKDARVERSKALKEAQAELFDRFNEITAAEAILMLIGQGDAQSLLRVYGEHVVSFRKGINNSSEPLSDEAIDAYRTYFLRSRASFFDRLHAAYLSL